MKNCLLIIFSLFIFNLYAAEKIKFVYFNTFAPYSFEKDGKMHGILVEINEILFHERLGFETSHKGYPWARAQEMVKAGTADAFTTVVTEERKTYTKPINEPSLVAYFQPVISKDKYTKFKDVKNLSDLRAFTHGQYLGNGWAKKNLVDFNIQSVANLETVLKMLAINRFDVFIDAKQVVNYNINQLNLGDKLEILPVILDSTTFNTCIGNLSKHQSIISKAEEELKKMRQDGTIEGIYKKY